MTTKRGRPGRPWSRERATALKALRKVNEINRSLVRRITQAGYSDDWYQPMDWADFAERARQAHELSGSILRYAERVAGEQRKQAIDAVHKGRAGDQHGGQ